MIETIIKSIGCVNDPEKKEKLEQALVKMIEFESNMYMERSKLGLELERSEIQRNMED